MLLSVYSHLKPTKQCHVLISSLSMFKSLVNAQDSSFFLQQYLIINFNKNV